MSVSVAVMPVQRPSLCRRHRKCWSVTSVQVLRGNLGRGSCINVISCFGVVMAAARSTPVRVILAEEEAAARLQPVTVSTDRRRASRAAAAAGAARTATAPATATARRARCRCRAAAAPPAGRQVRARRRAAAPARGSASTAGPSSRRRAPSSAASAAWRASRDSHVTP